MRGNLKNRVGRRVNNPVASSQMLGGELIDHFGSARNHVSNYASTGRSRETRDHSFRKSIGVSRKSLREMDTRDFPVTGCAVFPSRRRVHRAPRADRPIESTCSLEGGNVSKAAHIQSRKIKSSDRMSDVAKSVTALITIRCGVRSFAGANTIENDDRRTPHFGPPE